MILAAPNQALHLTGAPQYPLRVELPPYLQDYRAALLQHPATQWAADTYRTESMPSGIRLTFLHSEIA